MRKNDDLFINCRNSIHPEPCTVKVAPVVDPITRDIEENIADMEHYHGLFLESKQKLKQLKKFVKQRIKAELNGTKINNLMV
jgi:hypothetical protein